MVFRNALFAAAFAACGVLVSIPTPSAAQTTAQTAAPSASSEPAPLKYESTFTGYQNYRDEKRADWRELNDTVRALGGHAGHVRSGVSGAASAPAAAPVSPVSPMAPALPGKPDSGQAKPAVRPDPHAGHKM